MLTIIIPGEELFNEETEEFSTVGDVVLELEHSLVSLSKWESKWEKPFLGKGEKTSEEIFGYLDAMLLTPDVPSEVFLRLGKENINAVNDYIDSKQSATTFGQLPKTGGISETITAELVYYWMVALNIPFECQFWHLNRLFSLIRICGVKNQSPKKMSRAELAARNRELNAQRRRQLGTTG